MTQPCLLHLRLYRTIYEETVNKLESTGTSLECLQPLRSLQRAALCTCHATVEEQVRLDAPESTKSPDETSERSEDLKSSTQDNGACAEEGWEDIASARKGKAPPFEKAVREAQQRLEALAARRGHLAQLQPAISRLYELFKLALDPIKLKRIEAARRQKLSNKKAKKAATGGARWASRQAYLAAPAFSAYCVLRRPYAPIRWPPLRVTKAALQGKPVPSERILTSAPPSRTAQHQLPHVAHVHDSPKTKVLDERALELAERYEDKLRVCRPLQRLAAQRRTHRDETISHELPHPPGAHSLRKKQAHGLRRPRNSARCMRGSKDAARLEDYYGLYK